ncbi:MAG: adenosylcobinamide-GDP ribazoletransferase [Desulfosalsimonadaceae bacterium]
MNENPPLSGVKPLIAAIQFLTIIPVPVNTTPSDMARSLPWFPVAGLVCGIAAAVFFLLAHALGLPAMITGLIGILALSGFNGFFHLDGVADTADGFFSARPKEKILEIMHDSRIGTMGAVGLFSVLGLKWSALAAMVPSDGWRALVIAAVLARTAMVLIMGILPYARKEGGLISVFLKDRMPSHMFIASVSGLLAAAVLGGIAGIAALLFAAAMVFAFNFFCMKKIGGITGDTLGAQTEITETAVLFAMCAAL